MRNKLSKIFMVVVFMIFSFYSFAILQDELNEEQGWEQESSYRKQIQTKKTINQNLGRDLPEDGLLLIPDSAGDRVMAFDPETGDLYNADFIPADPTNLSTPIKAALHPDENSILVSDQVKDGLLQYDLDGNFIGWFAPAGGVNNAILDNVRGWSLRANGNILVTTAGGANTDAIVEFDTDGNHIGNFIANGAGGLDGPWSVLYRPEHSDYLVTASTSDAVHQYDMNGAYLGNLVSNVNFPEQITQTASGNLLVATFSTPSGCYEYTSDGTYVGYYDVVSGLRGTYELPNGNILVTNANGVFEIDRNNTIVETKISGVNARFIILAKQTSTTVGWIEGNVVLDGGTGNVEDVVVTAGTETVNPDANGDYSIEIDAGTYDVTASLEGYLDEIVVDVVVIEGEITGNIDFTLEWIINPFPPPENVQVDPYTGIATWDPPGGTIFADDFESYNVGEYLAVQSDDWTTWSGTPGGADDALVSDDFALSGTKSVKIEGLSDVVLIMDNYTSGCYSMEVNLYIVSGNTAHFNVQKTNTPGTEWAIQIYFDVTGEASADAGSAAACVFPFNFDEWLNFEIIADLDNDLGELWFNGTQLHTWQWTLGISGVPGLLSLGGLDLWAWDTGGGPALAYYDDINFSIVNAEPSDELTGYNVYLDGVLQDYTTELTYQYTGLVVNTDYIAGVSAVYDDPGESDIVAVPFTFLSTPIYPPVNFVATLADYNDVYLEWEQPAGTGDVLYTHTRTKRIQNNRENRMLLGYKVYRDGIEITYIEDPGTLTYTDIGVEPGVHEYFATAMYDEGESDPSNTESVEIILPIPQNVVASFSYPNVLVTWDAVSDNRDIESYNVYRDDMGTTPIGSSTSGLYVDINVPEGTYIYNVTGVFTGGWESAWSEDSNEVIVTGTDNLLIPVRTELTGNYPNPFNPVTTIKFALNKTSDVSIKIYNIKGAVVRTLVDGEMKAAYHEVIWDSKDNTGKQAGSGLYLYKMVSEGNSGRYTSTKKMILLK